ncbi:MAG: Gfo/Idh/MocA family oxidoreductase [Chloroflexota bacterium]
MSKQVLKVGAIGCGYWGPNLIRNFIEIPDADLAIIADLDEKQIDRIMGRFPQIPASTTNYKDFFEMDLDAVVIATPPQTHYKIAMECMAHGLHCLVEKPITLDSREAREMHDYAVANSLKLMVGHTFEYNTAVRELKSLIESGELGDVYYIDAVRASLGLFQTKANVLWDLAPHDLSIFRYLTGSDPVNVSAKGVSCIDNGIEDIAYATFTFPNRVLAHLRASWLDPSKTRKITVVGSKKMVVYDDVEPLEKIKIYDKGVKAIRRTETYGEFQFAYHYGDVVAPYYRFEEPLRVQCNHFLDCIRTGETPRSDGVNGLRVVQMLEAADYSMKHSGITVQVDYETSEITPEPSIAKALNGH